MPAAKNHDQAVFTAGISNAIVHNSDGVPQLSRKFVARRISEGETGRLKEELKCQACGKGYKHVSSLAKHLWEHTPEWNVTSKLLISKHQQVQLLEAASILVSMNEEPEGESTAADGNKELSAHDISMSAPTLASDDSSPSPEPPRDGDRESERELTPYSKTAHTPHTQTESPSPSPTIFESGSTSLPGVPVTSARSIQKQSSRFGRRVSISSSSVGSPAVLSLTNSVHGQVPLPETVLQEQFSSRRNRRRSTITRLTEFVDKEGDDGLHDPPKDALGSVFGDLEE